MRRASAATEDYTSGVQNPRTDWQAATLAAEGAQAAGVQQAISRKRFSKGVQRAGTARWQAKSTSLGAQRFAGGVAAGASDYANNVAPFLQTIEATTLPPRGPKGDPRNIQRVSAIDQALRAKKLSMS